MILALTGGTGFVGSHVIDRALAGGHRVRALTRRPQPERAGVEWIAGDLAEPGALCAGAEAVIHVAGAVNAADRAGFAAANVEGTACIVHCAEAAGVARFVHVSSLAAREPALSAYGQSKAEGDRIVTASALRWSIVRPPAIFGPRDRELLELFRIARRGIVPLPPAGGRLSVLYAPDLADLLIALAVGDEGIAAIVEPDDGAPGGWDQRDFARAVGVAVGRRVLPLPLPRTLLGIAGVLERAVRGSAAKLTRDRIRYFCHPDWAAHDHPPAGLWCAATSTPAALATTAAWYRANGLL